MMLELMLMMTLAGVPQTDSLDVRLVGNAGVRLSDGETTVLIDLPYVSGAFGYQTWEPHEMDPIGHTIAAFTHAHADHFDPELLESGWTLVGGEGVVEGAPGATIVSNSDVLAGEFTIRALPTPHSPGHRSYRVEWRGRALYFTGDTRVPAVLVEQQEVDVLFITPWLSCLTVQSGLELPGVDIRAYHLATDGSDRLCGGAVAMEQGSSFVLHPAGG